MGSAAQIVDPRSLGGRPESCGLRMFIMIGLGCFGLAFASRSLWGSQEEGSMTSDEIAAWLKRVNEPGKNTLRITRECALIEIAYQLAVMNEGKWLANERASDPKRRTRGRGTRRGGGADRRKEN
jgi:hypothetical protein